MMFKNQKIINKNHILQKVAFSKLFNLKFTTYKLYKLISALLIELIVKINFIFGKRQY